MTVQFSITCSCKTVLGMRRKYKFSDAPDFGLWHTDFTQCKVQFYNPGFPRGLKSGKKMHLLRMSLHALLRVEYEGRFA